MVKQVVASGNFILGQYRLFGVLSPAIQCFAVSRPSAKYARNTSGILQLFGIDIPAIGPGGLLMERQTQNRIPFSTTDLAAGGFGTSLVGAANSVVGPSLEANASQFVENNVNSAHYPDARASTPLQIGDVAAYSCWFQPTASPRRVQIFLSQTAGEISRTTFDLVDKTLISLGGAIAAYVESFSGGWVRCTVVFTSIGADNVDAIHLFETIAGELTYLGDGLSGWSQWGRQLEIGEGPSSYIPNPGATAITRPQDVLTLYARQVNDWILTFDDGSTQLFEEVNGNLVLTRDSINLPHIVSYEGFYEGEIPVEVPTIETQAKIARIPAGFQFAVNDKNDLFLGADGNLAGVVRINAVLNVCAHCAKAILGEMVLAANTGMPYFESVWAGNPSTVQFEAAFRDRIGRVKGVVEIISLETVIQSNTLRYEATIRTIYGEGSIDG